MQCVYICRCCTTAACCCSKAAHCCSLSCQLRTTLQSWTTASLPSRAWCSWYGSSPFCSHPRKSRIHCLWLAQWRWSAFVMGAVTSVTKVLTFMHLHGWILVQLHLFYMFPFVACYSAKLLCQQSKQDLRNSTGVNILFKAILWSDTKLILGNAVNFS